MFMIKTVRFYSRINTLDSMAKSYQDAVHMLNTLQSNAAVIEKIRQTRDAYRHLSLPDTVAMAQRTGVTLEDIDKLSVIHVSGTKGKGSTCAFSESILRSYGFKTGFFSSPHLVEVRERIRINGRPLSQDIFSQYFWHCYHLLEESKESSGGSMPPYFRFLTIMAFHVFIQEQVDVAIIEVGIGGQYDCTNIVRHPVVCGVTSLGIDHTSILGDTIEKIAWHKAGIFKRGVPAITVPQPDSALEVLKQRAAEIGCSLMVAPPLEDYMPVIRQTDLGIAGIHQVFNASLALQLCRVWLDNYAKSQKLSVLSTGTENSAAVIELTAEMAAGLTSCSWPGRSQIISGPGITYYLDGAHTYESIKLCAEWFEIESSALQASLGTVRVARVLLFNSTGDRKSDLLMSGLLDCRFDCALFCPNIQRLTGKCAEDVMDMKVTLESQLRRCIDNCNTWLDLTSSHPSTVNGFMSNNDGPMTTMIFNSIADSLVWVSRGKDERLLNDGQNKVVVTGVPECIMKADHVFVLCTGSLHLVGDILSLLDPSVCDR